MPDSPAVKLAKSKQRQRPPRNTAKVQRKSPVVCHCRKRRQDLNLSLRDVAEATGLSIAGLHAIEHGGDAQMTTAFKLCDFYGVGLGELWEAKQ